MLAAGLKRRCGSKTDIGVRGLCMQLNTNGSVMEIVLETFEAGSVY